ncbi:hypothetical protein IJD15_02720 [bacterium]|nr:hypothetical protein [bacterium]
MKFFKGRKKEEKPLLLTGYVEKTEEIDKKKKARKKLEERAELLYGEKTQEKNKEFKPIFFNDLDLYEESEPEIVIEKNDKPVKKEVKGKETLKQLSEKVFNNAKKQGLMFINENLHLEKPVKYAAEGNLKFLEKLEFITDAKENLKMANKDTYMDTPFAREHTIYNNVSEVSPFLRPYVVEKIKSQLGTSALKTTKGIFIDNDKPSSIKIANNEKIQDIIRENKSELKAYGYVKDTSVGFEFVFGNELNLFAAIGRADIVDIYLHPNGEITFYLIDTYEFNKNATDALNKAGRINQEKGILIPYFMIYSVKIDKETSEELLR